tara:strand:- start:6 stop:275 length:270 start_codon:yes stop_codon:yes gene_type:complete
MDTNRATTLITRAACGVVIATPLLLGVSWLEQKAAFKECVMEELMGEHGDRQSAEFSYKFRGVDGDHEVDASLEIARLNCKSGVKPTYY